MLTPTQPMTAYAFQASFRRMVTDEAPRDTADARPNNVRALREALGMTQADLAESSGLSQQQISKLERGAIQLKAYQLTALAKALRTDIDSLLIPRAADDGDAVLSADEQEEIASRSTDLASFLTERVPVDRPLSSEDRRKIASETAAWFRAVAAEVLKRSGKS